MVMCWLQIFPILETWRSRYHAVYDAYEDGEYRGDGPSYEGSWVFRFTL